MRALPEAPRRRARLMVATGAALSVGLIGGVLVLTFSGPSPQSVTALKPLQPQPSRAAAPVNPVPVTPPSTASEPYGGLGALAAPEAGLSVQTPAQTTPQAPILPVFQFPAPPQLPGIPTIDWAAALQPFIQSQANSIAANLAGASTGTVVSNSAAVAVGDLILYAAYNNDGRALLSQLQNAVPAADSPAPPAVNLAPLNLAPPPDLSGLSAAFAAAAGQPPVGVPSIADLPTPEQIADALAGLPALPPLPPPPSFGPPPIGLPVPPS